MRTRIIRKLGLSEVERMTSEWARSFTSTSLLSTSIDLFGDIGLLNKTIRQFMSMHPLLQANVALLDGEEHFVYDKRFPESAEPSTRPGWADEEADLDNVKYLVLDNKEIPAEVDKQAFYDDLSLMLAQKELSTALDYSKLLWRIVILRVSDEDPASQNHEYYLTLFLSHSISEGRNIHMLALQLLDLIEYNWNHADAFSRKALRQYDILPSMEDLYFENFEKDKHSNDRIISIPFVKKASFIDPAEASKAPLKVYEWSGPLKNTWIYRLQTKNDWPVKRDFLRLGDLIEESNSSFIKADRFSLSAEDSSKFIAVCKKKKCTVTLAFTNLMGFALKKLITITDEAKNVDSGVQFNSLLAISIRQHEPTLEEFQPLPPEFVENLTMGFYISPTFISLDYLMDLEASQLDDVHRFWNSAALSTSQLQRSIKNKEHYFNAERQPGPEECDGMHVVSSFGVMPGKLPDQFALSPRQCFTIVKSYSETSISEKEFWSEGPLSLYTFTCNGIMHMSFVYNGHIISKVYVDKFYEFFFYLLRKMLQ